jgi:iron complex transport system substrate-binding protein
VAAPVALLARACGAADILPRPGMSVLIFRPIVLCPALLIAACGGGSTDTRSGRSIGVDDYGDTLRVAARAPRRVVSLNPTTTEIVFAIGAGGRLVGRSHWDSWPRAALAIPELGPAIRPNVEAILAAHPDLVILYASADNRGADRRLHDAGVSVAGLRVDDIDDFRRAVRVIGMLLDDSVAAAVVADSVERTLARVREATRGLRPVSVFFPVWYSPIITSGKHDHYTTLIELAGGRNIYADLDVPSPTVTMEDVVRRDPDVVLASPDGRARILADPRWKALRAVREGRVLAYDTNVVGRPSVVLGEAAVSLARLLHPGSVP